MTCNVCLHYVKVGFHPNSSFMSYLGLLYVQVLSLGQGILGTIIGAYVGHPELVRE